MKNKCDFLEYGATSYTGVFHEYIRLITEWQLKDSSLWKKFVQQFRAKPDGDGNGWRGEYWGKMMRGACLTYRYTADEELYGVLKETVLDLLSTQGVDGRISTYTQETQLNGWDMWCRKYVLTGLQHFYDICKEKALRERILVALRAHADAILRLVGDEDGKKAIVDTSHIWGGVNSCSILEPFVRLYEMTKEERYLRFAEYIISTGGCKEGSLIAAVLDDEKKPHEYPTTKAYETMSFFEGVLAYYESTNEEKYFNVVERFADKILQNEITVIGCAGCLHEFFDNAAETQTAETDNLMQETCVTVTWMRLLARLLCLTGDVKYANALEAPIYNAMPGSVNTRRQTVYDAEYQQWMEAYPFDSYAPLYANKRGRAIGGLKLFAEGGSYGCCACIGSAGLALIPLTAFMQTEKGFVINEPYTGTMRAKTPLGREIVFSANSGYPQTGEYTLTLSMASAERFTVRVRIPTWCENATIRVGEEKYFPQDGYVDLDRIWKEGDVLVYGIPLTVREVRKNGKKAFFYGPIVLARDEEKEEGAKITSCVQPLYENGEIRFRSLPKTEEEQVRLLVRTAEGGEVLFTDYASCGKRWQEDNAKITVWIKEE